MLLIIHQASAKIFWNPFAMSYWAPLPLSRSLLCKPTVNQLSVLEPRTGYNHLVIRLFAKLWESADDETKVQMFQLLWEELEEVTTMKRPLAGRHI